MARQWPEGRPLSETSKGLQFALHQVPLQERDPAGARRGRVASGPLLAPSCRGGNWGPVWVRPLGPWWGAGGKSKGTT